MKHHDNDDCPHLVPMRLLESENARLKADFDVMHSSKLVYFIHGEGRWANVVDENARLKAEVERLKEVIRREVDGGVDLREEAQRTVEENHKLRAEVERLRKAGDRMAAALNGEYNHELPCVEDWNDAKEGKPSA